MLFRTVFDYPEMPEKISPEKGIFFIGSCFAVEIGEKMSRVNPKTLVNPFGTIFNSAALRKIFENAVPDSEHLVFREDKWVSLDASAKFYAESETLLEEKLHEAAENARNFLTKSETVVITLGTAWVYRYTKTQEIVANCQKIPQKNFEKILQTPDEVLADLEAIRENLSGKKVILTLSPVRHAKDTFPLNSVSKAVLRYAIHLFLQKYPDVYYLPVFEWINDDLRDYRFYKPDMLHPSDTAVDYVWDKFLNLCFEKKIVENFRAEEKRLLFQAHKPF